MSFHKTTIKWFQHQSNAHRDFNTEPLIEKYGMEGYGFFWVCGEIIAEKGEDYKILAEKGWKRYLISRAKIVEGKVDEILNEMAELNLIEKQEWLKGNLSMPKMSKYSDDYTKKIRRVSEQDTESVRTVSKSVRQDKIREDKIREDKSIYTTGEIVFENFWKSYPKKKEKPKARSVWQKLRPDKKLIQEIMAGLEKYKLSEDWIKENGRFIPYPERFLKNEKWEDEIKIKEDSISKLWKSVK